MIVYYDLHGYFEELLLTSLYLPKMVSRVMVSPAVIRLVLRLRSWKMNNVRRQKITWSRDWL